MNTEANERLEQLSALIDAGSFSPEGKVALRALVQLVIDSAYNPVREARGVLRSAFLQDPEFLSVYRDNIACWIMDFEAGRYCEPGVNPGPMGHGQRDQLAAIILKNLFDL